MTGNEFPFDDDRKSALPPLSTRKPSDKQQIILRAILENGEITLSEAVGLIGWNLYCNASFHVGNVLSNMVKRGMIRRIGRGRYSL